MKNLFFMFFIFTAIGFFNSSYGCDKKITSKNFILFIDMNGGIKEIEEAKKAACIKGQELLVYPEQTASVFKAKKEYDDAVFRMQSQKCTNTSTSKICEELKGKLKKSYKSFEAEVHPFNPNELHQQLEKMSGESRYVDMLVMSGHGDAHSVYGEFGSTDFSDVYDIFTGLDDQGRSVKSLILLSCYSANPASIVEWKKNLTELKMIAGSDSTAPASDRPAGLKYLKDLMIKVNEITADADEKKLKNKLQNLIPSLNQINSAIYIDDNKCGEELSDKRLYYSKSSGVKIFNPEDCIKSEAEYVNKERKITEYVTGKIEIPTETQGTELRELYTFLRQNEHCLSAIQARYSANMLYGLLFYNSVKVNVIRAYKKQADEINKTMDFLRKNTFPLYAQDISDFEKIWPLNEENIRKKSRQEILVALNSLDRLGSLISDGQERYHYYEALSKMNDSLKDMSCVSNQWHVEQLNPAIPDCRENDEDEDIDL